MKKKYPYLIVLLFLSVLCFACGAKTNKNNSSEQNIKNDSTSTSKTNLDKKTSSKTHFPTGKIIDTLRVDNNPSLAYALFLPSNYTRQTASPIIYCFDPQGSGEYPLALYKSLAETFHIILVGIYNSKNGMSFQTISKNVQEIRADVQKKLSIDERRIYTCGFSGGAKIAGIMAALDKNIKGVIACGAGLPQLNKALTHRFDYFGIAGLEGLNYVGVKEIDAYMEKIHFRHQFLSFQGKHQWPPLEIMKMAFIWQQLNAMKDNIIPKNDSLIQAVKAVFLQKIKQNEKENKPYKEYLNYKNLGNYLKGLDEVSAFQVKADSLKQSQAVQKIILENENLYQKEIQLDREYLKYFENKSIADWKNLVDQLHLKQKTSPSSAERNMYQRVLGFLSLEAYMKSSSALKTNNLSAASQFITVFTKVDPKNPDTRYLSASLAMLNGDKSSAMDQLKEGIRLGYNKVEHFKTDPVFLGLKNNPQYQSIIDGMIKNKGKGN